MLVENIVSSELRGLHIDYVAFDSNLIGVYCHFKDAEIKKIKSEIEFNETALAACPVNCMCKTAADFVLNQYRKTGNVPISMFGEGRCLHNGVAIEKGKTAFFSDYFVSKSQSDLCEQVCGELCRNK